jgi:hypothetical protein
MHGVGIGTALRGLLLVSPDTGQDVPGEAERVRCEVVAQYALISLLARPLASQETKLTLELLVQTHRACELLHLLEPVELFVIENDQARRLARRADRIALVVRERLYELGAR